MEIAHGLIHQQLLQRPLLDVPRLVVFKLMDVLHRASKYGAFGFFATGSVGYNCGELINPLVDVPSPSSFDFFLLKGTEAQSTLQPQLVPVRTHVIVFPSSIPLFIVLMLPTPLGLAACLRAAGVKTWGVWQTCVRVNWQLPSIVRVRLGAADSTHRLGL